MPIARDASCSRWSAVSVPVCGKKTTSDAHWRTSCACWTASAAQHPDLLFAYLVAVAVRAMQDVLAPALADPWDVGQLVTKTGGHEHAASSQLPAACEQDLEPRSGASQDFGDGAVDDGAAVTLHLFLSGGQEVVRRNAVAREEPMHVGGGRVAWRPGIHHGDLASGPGQDQRR